MQAVRLFILRKKTHKEHVQIYTNTQIIFLLESLYNYLYLGLLLQDVHREKKTVLRKKTHNHLLKSSRQTLL